MPGPKDRRGRSLAPQDPARCPECGETIGRRGMVRHLVDRHSMPIATARPLAREAVPVAPDGSPLLAEMAGRAVDLLAKIEGLPRLELPAEAESRVRAEWERELSALREKISGA